MASPVLRIAFVDGRTEEVTLNLRVLVEMERKFGQDPPPVESTLYGAWHRLGRPGPFDDFIDSVESVDPVEAEEAVPTQPGPSDGS